MKYLEDNGFINDGITTFKDLAVNNVYWKNRFFSVCSLESYEDVSKIKTPQGMAFYKDTEKFINEYFDERFYRRYEDYRYPFKDNKSIGQRCSNIFHSINEKYLPVDESSYSINNSLLLAEFIYQHFWDVFGKYGIDVENNLEDLERVYKIKKNNGKVINYERVIPLEIQDVLSRTLDDIYNIYINSYENVCRYGINQLYSMIQGLRLTEINIDEILLKYDNLTKEDIYKLLIYNIKDEYFERYLKLLNSLNEEEKNKVFEYIKPVMYYFQYLPKYWSFATDNIYSHLKYLWLSPKNNLMVLEKIMFDIFFGNSDDITITLESYYQFKNRPELEYCINYYKDFFENIFFEGYSQEVMILNTFFINQIDLLETITPDYLDELVNLKKMVISNPIKSKMDILIEEERKKEILKIYLDKSEIVKLKEFLIKKQNEIMNRIKSSKAKEYEIKRPSRSLKRKN